MRIRAAATGTSQPPEDADAEPIRIGPRWPIALALCSYIAITVVLRLWQPTASRSARIGSYRGSRSACSSRSWQPTPVAGACGWLRWASILLVVSLVVVALLATGVLIADPIRGGKVTESASTLLASGALVWLGNWLTFGLLYWLLDSGGPLARYHGERAYPDFAFSQQLSPELAPPGWRPRYVDYLILGLTTSTAFSPTDVMPMSSWAKLTMALQSLVSLLVIGLVIARAVNIFS